MTKLEQLSLDYLAAKYDNLRLAMGDKHPDTIAALINLSTYHKHMLTDDNARSNR